ncbi:YczE/YyaS/YitT family protein [Peptacetobacter sp.]|uniref:YczE/YyaS/YitT family protein n=1 Tax=Peptacetobacter sp. TaxID=2991975 RepID=UPI002637690D|nr:hypothetical protein [Peptacetobacter sp.]
MNKSLDGKKINNNISLFKLIRLFLGFFIGAMGTVFMINANIGLSPWDVLHRGVSKNLGITMGQASITVSIMVIILDQISGEYIGWGTVLNVIFFGLFIDLITYLDFVPHTTGLLMSIFMIISGLIFLSICMWLYIGVGLGTGPRDGMMMLFHKRSGKPIGVIRSLIELVVLIIGYFLGGPVGLGTIISAFGMGIIMQTIFKIVKFDAKEVNHKYIEFLISKKKLNKE